MKASRKEKLHVALFILALSVPLGRSHLGSAHPATSAAGVGAKENRSLQSTTTKRSGATRTSSSRSSEKTITRC
jgi:hypothetical protein